jgi:four helix bundle protein
VGIERFEELKSWQEARRLMQIVYRLTQKDRFKEDRALTWQLRDAAVSTMGNIARPVK